MVTLIEEAMQQLRAAREQQGLTQAQLGERLEVSRATINRWETGERSPDLATLERIAKALGFTLRLTLESDVNNNETVSRPIESDPTYELFKRLNNNVKDKIHALIESILLSH